MRQQAAGHNLQRAERRVALGKPAPKRLAPDGVGAFSGKKKIGSQPSANSAVSSTLRSPSDAR